MIKNSFGTVNGCETHNKVECARCDPRRYTAIDNNGKIWYQHQPHGNLWGHLPIGARPIAFAEGDDPWNGATFALESGRVITITLDETATQDRPIIVWTRGRMYGRPWYTADQFQAQIVWSPKTRQYVITLLGHQLDYTGKITTITGAMKFAQYTLDNR